MSAKEAEAEWIDNKARVKSAVISEDPGKKEREELKQNRKVNRECESSKFTSKTWRVPNTRNHQNLQELEDRM